MILAGKGRAGYLTVWLFKLVGVLHPPYSAHFLQTSLAQAPWNSR